MCVSRGLQLNGSRWSLPQKMQKESAIRAVAAKTSGSQSVRNKKLHSQGRQMSQGAMHRRKNLVHFRSILVKTLAGARAKDAQRNLDQLWSQKYEANKIDVLLSATIAGIPFFVSCF